MPVVYSPTPLLIDGGSQQPNKPNAIRLDTSSVPKLEAACPSSNEDQVPEIGLDPAMIPDIDAVKKDLELNPPQKFDVSRAVRVFNSRIQYVKLSFTGYQLSKKGVPIPISLLGLGDNKEILDRWKNNFRVFGDKAGFTWKRAYKDEEGRNQIETVTEMTLEEDKERIVEDFLNVLPKFGTVILRCRRQEFDKRVADFEKKVKGFREVIEVQLSQELAKSRSSLAQDLAKRLMSNLPPIIKKTMPDNPDLKAVTDFIDNELCRVFGNVNDVFAPKVEKHFMEVSPETLDNSDFIEALRKTFRSSFDRLFSEYNAALASGPTEK